jgi:hypothetical protein
LCAAPKVLVFSGCNSHPATGSSRELPTAREVEPWVKAIIGLWGSSQTPVFPLDASAPQSRIPGRVPSRHDPERRRRHSHAARERVQALLWLHRMTHSTALPDDAAHPPPIGRPCHLSYPTQPSTHRCRSLLSRPHERLRKGTGGVPPWKKSILPKFFFSFRGREFRSKTAGFSIGALMNLERRGIL